MTHHKLCALTWQHAQLEYGEVDERYDFFRKCVSTQLAEARYKQRDRFYGDDD